MIDPTTLAAIRFGHGLPLPQAAPTGAEAMIAALTAPDTAARDFPTAGLPDILPLLRDSAEGRKQRRDTGDNTALKAARAASARQEVQALRTCFARSLDSPDGFRERLVAFWADHFTTRPRLADHTALSYALVEDALRPNVTGKFGDMLVAATLHPAMLIYLDQFISVGPGSRFGKKRKRGLNENLAREVMELHSLGVGGGYVQADVRQMAELLTGLGVNLNEGTVFRASRAEPGAETVLGRSYDGEGLEPIHAALHDLALRPETAAHIARKLAVHFVSDTPDNGLVAAMADAYRSTDGSLLAVYTALLQHPAAWQPQLQKARQPVDFLIAAFRALGISGPEVMGFSSGSFSRMVRRPLLIMGQRWQRPNGPDGWPEAETAWITPQGLGARISWAMQVPGRLVTPLPDPVALAQRALGPAADERLLWAAARAESLREGVGLVLASPAFNRR